MYIPYTGNGSYCFTDSLHMCLRAAQFDSAALPDTGFLECLTTMPFGVTYLRFPDSPLLFFSSPDVDPVIGLDRALDALGWTCQRWQSDNVEERDQAMARLREAVASSPVLVGPIDMGYLSYDPHASHKAGADHFVVVLEVGDEYIRFHDPQGYPNAILPLTQFLETWSAERINYTEQHYTMRYRFTPIATRKRSQMIEHTLPHVSKNIADNPGGPEVYGSVEALHVLAEDLQEAVSPPLADHLILFALPVAARRTVDACFFMQEAGLAEAATLLKQKAMLLGAAQYHATHEQWPQVVSLVKQIAETEAALLTAVQAGSGSKGV